ncbi:DUF6918 family protein [Limnofasciculus baicalensis]|uniref:Uncharacterized protein n=1 Tax=Limnofasciculus baicalensis BBK-W-15 TaxID=2699891 RepID=A0AAE3KQG6_9CYAN|nr:hypothetical protein [Limnofasciculus baicalensis]MCP2731806.1 hypothetical protein [Limnofasciculus baicalensis BBK-W-15]
MGLIDGLADREKKNILVADFTQLIDTQVASMKGVSGLALKAGYSAVKGIAPSYCSKAIEWLLPEFFNVLDPIWAEGMETGDPVGHLIQNSDPVAEILLSVTDGKIKKSNNTTVRAVYGKLRNSAKKHVEDAVPGVAKIIDTYTKS